MNKLCVTLLYTLLSTSSESLHIESYPLEDYNIPKYITQMQNHHRPDVAPINAYAFSYISSPICHQESYYEDPALRLTVVVKSAVGDFQRRNAIRSTWGQEYREEISEISMRTVFNLGYSTNKYIQKMVELESDVFGDIIQSNFHDTYFNNTYKTVMGIKWAFQNCRSTDFFFFVDEDFIVLTRNLVRFLLSKKDELTKQSLYMGYVHKNPKPFRNNSSKWFVSEEEYPYNLYPPFVAGGGVIYSQKGLQNIHFGTSYTKHFRLDDVFIGLVSEKSNVQPQHNPDIHVYRKVHLNDSVNGLSKAIASHGFGNIDEMINVWNQCEQAGFA